MKIPIFNSLYSKLKKNFKSKELDFKVLNNLELKKVDNKKFPLVKIIHHLVEKDSLYETILITVNDFFVQKYLNDEIQYSQMVRNIYKYSKYKEFLKYRNSVPKNVKEIYNLRDYVSLKLSTLSV